MNLKLLKIGAVNEGEGDLKAINETADDDDFEGDVDIE
jgi:hypothetical protein